MVAFGAAYRPLSSPMTLLGSRALQVARRASVTRSLSTAGGAKSTIVIGGGFVGLSCALHLQRIGRKVTLLEGGPEIGGASAASSGNAGTFCVYANVPINNPGIFGRLPGMLSDQSGPLSLRLTPQLPAMLPWAALFAWNCRPSAVEHTADALGRLLSRADEGWDAAFRAANVDVDGAMGAFSRGDGEAQRLPFAVREGYLLLQRTEEAMRASEAGAALRRRGLGASLRMHALTAGEVMAMEPNLEGRVCGGGAWYFPDGWFLNEPAALMRALAAGFEAGGGEVRTGAAAVGVRVGADGRPAVELGGGGEASADEVVVAAGAHSGALAASLGERVPLGAERGYHVEFGGGSRGLLRRAVCDPSQGFIATPMAGGLRVAGKVELGGLSAGPTARRLDDMEAQTREMVRGVGERVKGEDWLGFRPSMPDALPVIGRSTKVPSVIYAFGHQHVGWTLAGITGQLVAELSGGGGASLDLEAYGVDRFRGMRWVTP